MIRLLAISSLLFMARQTFGVTGLVETGVARSFDPARTITVFHLEPSVEVPLTSVWKFNTLLRLENAFGTRQILSLPKIALAATFEGTRFGSMEVIFSPRLRALNLHEWSTEGVQLEPGAYASVSYPILKHLTLTVELGTFLGLNQYRVRRDGTPFTSLGFSEELALHFRKVEWDASLSFVFEQWGTQRWSNWISHSLSLAYWVSKTLALGGYHELVAPTIHATSGRRQGFQFFDSEYSRMGIFGKVAM